MAAGRLRLLSECSETEHGATRAAILTRQVERAGESSTAVCQEPCTTIAAKWHAEHMILEHAILPVRPGLEREFEAAFERARPLIAVQRGFQSLRLSRSLETPREYLLLVEWDSVEAHTEGFRQSPEYLQWKELLHRFYEPFPVVEHFAAVSVITAEPHPESQAPGTRRE